MKRIPPFRNRQDVIYLVHKEPTTNNENGIYIVKPKDNSYVSIWAVVWQVPIKLMSTADGYTKQEIDKTIKTIKDDISSLENKTTDINNKLLLAIKNLETKLVKIIEASNSNVIVKKAVKTYADLAITYPEPSIGWDVLVLSDENYKDKRANRYRWNGQEWVDMHFGIPSQDTLTIQNHLPIPYRTSNLLANYPLISSYGNELLVNQGSLLNKTRTDYSITDLIKLESRVIRVQLLLGLNDSLDNRFLEFYSFDKVKISNSARFDNKDGFVENKLSVREIDQVITVPESAVYVQLHSINDTHTEYYPYDFKLSFLDISIFNNPNGTASYNISSFKKGLWYVSGLKSQSYSHLLRNISEGDDIFINVYGFYFYAYHILDSNYEIISSLFINDEDFEEYIKGTDIRITAPKDSAYIAINTVDKSVISKELADKVKVKITRSLTNNKPEILEDIIYDEDYFNIDGTLAGVNVEKYSSTDFLPVFKYHHLEISTSVKGWQCLYFYNINKGVISRYPENANLWDYDIRTNNLIEIPKDAYYVRAIKVKNIEDLPLYQAHLGDFYIRLTDNSVFDFKAVDNVQYDESYFFIKEYPTVSQVKDKYKSTPKIPVKKGYNIDYKSVVKGGANLFIYNLDGMKTKSISESEYSYTMEEDGFIVLATMNEDHPQYDKNAGVFLNIYKLDINLSLENKDYNKGANHSLSLKCMKEFHYGYGDTVEYSKYIWYSYHTGCFYASNTHRGDKTFIFKWDDEISKNKNPDSYSASMLPNGDVLFVYRTETESMNIHSDDIRRNPILYQKIFNYKPLEIDFGEEFKPSGWLQNCGFVNDVEHNKIYLSEYTRPSVETANAWEVNYPITNPSNWKRILTKELSGDLNKGFKHFHHISKDPYTGVIYATTGDDDSAAAIYALYKGEDQMRLIAGTNEEKCRLLNFVFLEDAIYWASDSWYSKHSLFRAERGEDGYISEETIKKIADFPSDSFATYATVYLETEDLLVFLDRRDLPGTQMDLFCWDLINNKLIKLDTIYSITKDKNVHLGFRCEAVELYPKTNSFAVGFGRSLLYSTSQNFINKLNNKDVDSERINNLILTVKRNNNNTFKISYSTSHS